MSFTSLNFLLFVALAVIIYFLVPLKHRWLVLLTASYAFYLISSPESFIFMLITTVSTFYGGLAMGKCDEQMEEKVRAAGDSLDRAGKKALKAEAKAKKKRLMILILVFNFAILAFMKYFRVYLKTLSEIFDAEWLRFNAGILIPLGISFYTFQAMSYIIDLNRGKYKPDKNLFKFALFVSWFPLIVQGPISRYDQLAMQLQEGHEFDYTRIKFGGQLIMWGFFKKLVIADRIAILANTVFDNYQDYRGMYLIIGALAYTIQIYADFSGGIDIARGVSQIFGIELENNFERPYFSRSLTEFWRRWHMTLGHWCRDYIFYPISLSKTFGKLGRNSRRILGDRVGKLFPVIVAQLATFLTIGIWHGAQFKYIAYGLYQAFFIVGGMLLEPYLLKLNELLHINTEAGTWKLFQMLRTFCIVVFGRFFSRAHRFRAAVHMMKASFVFNPAILFNGQIYTLGLNERDFSLLITCLLLWLCISIAQEKGYSIREVLSRQNTLFRWAIYLIGFISIVIFGVYGVGYDASTFIYRTF